MARIASNRAIAVLAVEIRFVYFHCHCEKGGLSGKYWGEVERGEKSPTHEMMLRMAKALNIPLEAMVRREREEGDGKTLRKRIDSILDKSPTKHLKRVYFYLLDTLEGRSDSDF